MSLARAQKLYDQKKYYDSVQECINLIKNNQDLREANLLAAKGFLFLLKHPIADDSMDTLSSTAKRAIMNCKNMQEIYDAKYEIRRAVNEWKPLYIKGALEQLENDPSLESYKVYIPCKAKCAELNIYMMMATIHPEQKQWLENEGLTANEAEKKYYRTPDNEVSDDAIKLMEYESAQRIFATVQNYMNDNSYLNSDVAADICRNAVSALLMIDMLMDSCTPKTASEEIPKVKLIEQLQFHINVLIYLMDTTVSVNGQPISIYMGDRDKTYNEISALYGRLKALDPSFVNEYMPNVNAVKMPESSGGCYVATAVYGSYDCPEVWTLRRYRDNSLAQTWYGKAFIHLYYAVSPTLVKWFGDTEWFKKMWKGKLDRLVEKLNKEGFESSPYQDKNW